MISNDYMKDSNLQAQIAELANSVGSGAKIQTGSYVGTGTYGASNPCSLTFDFVPKFIYIIGTGKVGTFVYPQIAGNMFVQYGFAIGAVGTWMAYAKIEGNTLSWYATANSYEAETQYNGQSCTYYYAAIG